MAPTAGAAIIAEDFTFENVRKVVHAIARYVVRAEKPGAGILVGYDTRFGSERFARVAAETVSAAGMPVWLAAEAAPTPAISLLVRQRGAAGGIQITASHNPYRWNGVKYKASYGSSASPAIVAQIETELAKVLRDGVPALPPRARSDSFARSCARHIWKRSTSLVDWDRLRAAKFRFVIDPMHGAGRGLLRELFRRHGIDLRRNSRHARSAFWRRESGTDRAAHRSAAPRRACTANTTRASRSMATPTASARWTATARSSLRIRFSRSCCGIWPARASSQATWSKTFSTTKMIDKIAAKFGRKVWETPIGFKYICDRMLESDILIGGEESGGIGTKLYLPERDATVNALLLAEVMAWHGKRLGELVAMLHRRIRRTLLRPRGSGR